MEMVGVGLSLTREAELLEKSTLALKVSLGNGELSKVSSNFVSVSVRGSFLVLVGER